MKINTLTPEVVKDKIVMVRVDFNVPLKNGKIKDITRIKESLKTLQYLLNNGAKQIHLLTHIGRPKEKDESFSTKILTKTVQTLLGEPVEYRENFTAGEGRVQLHENTRFYEGETTNDPIFAQMIYDGIQPDIFVNDGFAVSHRSHTSVVGFADFVPCYAGFLIEKEIRELTPFLTETKIPGLTVVMSGVKMETKIPVLEHFAKISDNILLGGAIANTFMVAQGYTVGKSIYEEKFVKNARRILTIANEYKTGIHIPLDVVCAETPDSQEVMTFPSDEGFVNLGIFDIGNHTINSYCEILQHSKIVIWNGPLGIIEKPLFEKGTHAILECIRLQKSTKTILGGGDTIKILKKWNVPASDFTHVSTGGGAMLEFLEGKNLPGIEILK